MVGQKAAVIGVLPYKTPQAQQDKKQDEKEKVSKHFRAPESKMQGGVGRFAWPVCPAGSKKKRGRT
jgi:hypothetical protein